MQNESLVISNLTWLDQVVIFPTCVRKAGSIGL
jgi:hypothetical protein